jgi:hypothetical protein
MYDVAIRKNFAEAIQLHADAAKAMKETGARYHELRQCFCFARAAEVISRKKELSDDDKKQARTGSTWPSRASARPPAIRRRRTLR